MMPARSIAFATTKRHGATSSSRGADRARLAVMQFNPAGSTDIGAAFVRHLVARRIDAIPEIVELSVYPLEGRQVVSFAAELREAH
jgi:hypothetical protein